MFARLRTLTFVAAASLGLAACAYDDGYGYGGLSVGYGSGYYGGYYDDYYDPYGGYGYPASYGWYGGFYYPGTGYWVYDRRGHRHRWSDSHRHHWEGRRGQSGGNRGANWSGYRRGGGSAWQGRSSAGTVATPPSVNSPQPNNAYRGAPRSSFRQSAPSMRSEGVRGSRGWSGRGRGGGRRN